MLSGRRGSEAVVVVSEVAEILILRRQEWGRSASVLTTRFVDDDPDAGLIVEMQSGDVLVVRGRVRRDLSRAGGVR